MERTTVNKSFTASGRLEVTLTPGWERQPILSQRDSGRATLEDLLPALVRVGYERNAERLLAELDSRDAAAAMRTYADEIDARAATLKAPAAQAARAWAEWIREHAEHTDPLNGPLRLEEVASCSHEELQLHMHGWSTYGPYRH